jgi:hypothetical protein
MHAAVAATAAAVSTVHQVQGALINCHAAQTAVGIVRLATLRGFSIANGCFEGSRGEVTYWAGMGSMLLLWAAYFWLSESTQDVLTDDRCHLLYLQLECWHCQADICCFV